MWSGTATYSLVILQVLVVPLVFGAPDCENLDCDSWKFKYKSCPIKMRINDDATVTVVQQRSVSICTLGTSFGIRKNKVWVDKGCRAEFQVCKKPNTIICEHDSGTISCDKGTISITSASYGRSTGPEVCPHPEIKTTDCDAATSMSVVSNACNGKTSCTLTASNSVFGDPCLGTYKYLEVSFECTNNGGGSGGAGTGGSGGGGAGGAGGGAGGDGGAGAGGGAGTGGVCSPGRFYAAHADCSKFYQCDEHGGVFVHDCPDGLLWNDPIQTCDWPKNVICKNFCGKDRFYAAHNDCSKFYQCDEHGGVFVHDCPAGLYWNDPILTCDWPNNVNCKNAIPK